jgi:hypothetical protein
LKSSIVRIHSQLECEAEYDVEILHWWRKDLQEKSFIYEELVKKKDVEKCSCNIEDDDCWCNITFFPEYINIIEFKVINKNTNFIRNDIIDKDFLWNFCIDSRFSTSDELLSRYKQLVNIPEYSSFTNEHCDMDKSFYAGYYNMIENPVNIHILEGQNLDELKDDILAHNKNREDCYKQFKISIGQNVLSSSALIGVNTIGSYFKNDILDCDEDDDIVKKILRDINQIS